MKIIKITEEYANALLQYLSQRPYQEVANLIQEMHKAANDQMQEDKVKSLEEDVVETEKVKEDE